jgi:hypothetical protein
MSKISEIIGGWALGVIDLFLQAKGKGKIIVGCLLAILGVITLGHGGAALIVVGAGLFFYGACQQWYWN